MRMNSPVNSLSTLKFPASLNAPLPKKKRKAKVDLTSRTTSSKNSVLSKTYHDKFRLKLLQYSKLLINTIMTTQYSFLSDNTRTVLSNLKNEIETAAKFVADFPIKSMSANPRVIPLDKLKTLLDKLPFIEANQVVKNKLR